MKYLTNIYTDFIGWTKLEYAWLFIAVSAVFVTTLLDTVDPIIVLASLSNILCVILVAKQKISNYYWGLIGVLSYAYVSYTFSLFGEMQLNLIMYLPMQFIGFYLWSKHTSENNSESETVKVRSTGLLKFLLILLITAVATYIYSFYLASIGGEQVLRDAFTTVASTIAMITLMLRYKESWILWIMVNVVTIIIWSTIVLGGSHEAMPMLVQWSVFMVNSVLGAYMWYKN